METENYKKSANGKLVTAFYEPPHRKTSAEIINEARHAIRESQMGDSPFSSTSIKPLQTQRPFTPRDKERHLFGSKAKSNRPPSSFSLSYLKNQPDSNFLNVDNNLPITPKMLAAAKVNHSFLDQANTVKTRRSNSLVEMSDNKIFNIGIKESSLHKIRLPSLERPLTKRKLFQKNATSLDNLPEENEIISETKGLEMRKAFSSPQERTEYTKQSDSPFDRPSKQQNLSQCLLLGPENLNKIFDNKQIIENSSTLFLNKVLDSESKTTEDVISCLNFESMKKYNDDVILRLLEDLYSCMEKEKILNNKANSQMKIHILKCLYKFVESENEQILLSIARIILALKVTGNNLSGVCKLIFKVSKNDKNDYLFFQKNLLELFLDALGRSSPIDDAEACIYGYGVVKFLTMNQKLLHKILTLGILELMVLHMKIMNRAKIEKINMPDQTTNVLFQLTGALRNLVSDENIYDLFNTCGTSDELCTAMEVFSYDADIMSNISRTLSTISTNDCCCDKLIENKNIYRIFVKLFDQYAGNEEIIVRLTYTMGNIVAKVDNTRVKFYEEENSLRSLLNLWKVYLERTLHNCSIKIDNENVSNSEDVMIKVIRVIANMVINPEIGKEINAKFGNQLIDEFLKVLISNPFKKNGELVLSILSTLNNLSYYYTTDLEQDVFHIKQVDIVESVMEYTKSPNKDCVIEAMRILGNLSRSKITRNFIAESDMFQILVDLLDRVDVVLLKTTIGVFVNLMADNKSRELFKEKNGVSKLVKILDTFGQRDWPMATLICQVLWNYSIDCMDLYDLFSDDEIQKLLVVLADYLDDEKLFGITEDSQDSDIFLTQEYLVWDEFANVATNLLEKIEYFLDTFDQIKIEDNHIKMKDSSTNLSFAAW